MLKWAPFDWSSLWYSVEVMLFEKAFDVWKATKFTCKNFFYAKWFWELLNVANIIVRTLVFGVLWNLQFGCNTLFATLVFHSQQNKLAMHVQGQILGKWWKALRISRLVLWLCGCDVWVFLLSCLLVVGKRESTHILGNSEWRTSLKKVRILLIFIC